MANDRRISKFFPFLLWWPEFGRKTFKSDLLAGLTGAVIVLPQGVAFAIIAGLPPQYGLYSAIVPAIVAALFGSSRHLISGPTTAISLVLFATISRFTEPGGAEYIQMVLTLTFLAGVVQLALGSVRLGALVNFISHSVVVGFTAGAAILIGTSQIGGLLGVSVPRDHSFIRTWQALFTLIAEANPYVVGIAAATLAAAVVFRLYTPKLPGMLVAMVLGSALSLFMDGAAHGVKLVGSLPSSLPPLSSPDLSLRSVRLLFPGALAVAMLGLVEAVSIARSVATRSQQRIDNNQEFIGQGLSNIVGSFFSCYAASGSFTRTGVNYSAGARTPMSAVFAALSLMAILLLIAPLTAYLPIGAMAGILVLVAFNLIDVHHIKTIMRTSRQEAVVMAVTFLSTLFVELEFAIYIGVLLSLMLYLNHTSHPHFVTLVPDAGTDRHSFRNLEHHPTPECPQLKILRVDGSLFFGAVNHMAEEIARIRREFPEQCHLLVVATGINFIDVAGCEMLAAEAHRLHMSGGKLYLCNLKHDVQEVLERGGYVDRIGEENIFHSKTDALKEIVQRLDPERCRLCAFRIFHECGERPRG